MSRRRSFEDAVIRDHWSEISVQAISRLLSLSVREVKRRGWAMRIGPSRKQLTIIHNKKRDDMIA